eukprot:1185541-Prorocentrum_minimum.AAC.3
MVAPCPPVMSTSRPALMYTLPSSRRTSPLLPSSSCRPMPAVMFTSPPTPSREKPPVRDSRPVSSFWVSPVEMEKSPEVELASPVRMMMEPDTPVSVSRLTCYDTDEQQRADKQKRPKGKT